MRGNKLRDLRHHGQRRLRRGRTRQDRRSEFADEQDLRSFERLVGVLPDPEAFGIRAAEAFRHGGGERAGGDGFAVFKRWAEGDVPSEGWRVRDRAGRERTRHAARRPWRPPMQVVTMFMEDPRERKEPGRPGTLSLHRPDRAPSGPSLPPAASSGRARRAIGGLTGYPVQNDVGFQSGGWTEGCGGTTPLADLLDDRFRPAKRGYEAASPTFCRGIQEEAQQYVKAALDLGRHRPFRCGSEPSNEPVQAGQSNTDASDRTSCEALDPMPTGNPSEATAVERVDLPDDVGGCEGERDSLGANTQNDAGIPSRLDRRRKRRRGEPMLPRGQRWKRRLPKALRRVT